MAIARVSTDDITVTFHATMVRDDYGVPGSPTWFSPEDIEVHDLEILGVEVDFKALPGKLQDAILELAEGAEFEAEEECDYAGEDY